MMKLHLVFILTIMAASFTTVSAKENLGRSLQIGGGILSVQLVSGVNATPEAQFRWVEKAAQSITQYFGRYPVKNVSIDIVKQGSGSNIGGTTWGGGKIRLRLGEAVTDEDLKDDWTVTHEMFHLAFPDMGDDYTWMMEGLASYLEPLARARKGFLDPKKVWKDYYLGFPKGAPGPGDRGLDITHTWGRTYWGGAAFWFEADIEIREKTKNKKSLDTACRAILDQGGDGSEDWTLQKVISVGDKATGLTVISDLHKKMGLSPGWINFDETWKSLGVSLPEDHIIFNDKAPLAFIRQAMTQKIGL